MHFMITAGQVEPNLCPDSHFLINIATECTLIIEIKASKAQ